MEKIEFLIVTVRVGVNKLYGDRPPSQNPAAAAGKSE
jgi:hypothetical protein